MNNFRRTLLPYLIMMALLSIPVFAQATGSSSTPNAATEGEIKAQETELENLLLKGDWQQYASYLADDFWQVGQQLENKKAVWAALQSGKWKYLYLTPDEEQVRSYGDIAILNLHLSIVARENGKVTTTLHRITKVFRRENGKWLLVSLTDVPVSH